ncbi:MAG: hypothetical protein M1819_006271 [Sarea resinae]|nr:MAG: hypothetical protein M1819_006271 [Sarea resinae]
MSFKGISKGGWHPQGKGGGKETWRGDFKGIDTVAGWMGKKRDPHADEEEHMSRPLATLKDPALFPPPPKHINYHGPAAAPDRLTPDHSGLGAPLSREEIEAQREAEEAEARAAQAEAERPATPPGPYRADRTGLSTDHLPKPPLRRLDQQQTETGSVAPRPKPSLPPRLPPRQSSNSSGSALSPPPSYGAATQDDPAHSGYLNQGSLNRLGRAGVSVPGLEIGPSSGTSTPQPEQSVSRGRSPAPPPSSAQNPQLGELNSRFSKMSTSSPKPEVEASDRGTSYADKQAALKTANSFHKDPSSVSMSDARSAGSTANNFRERHGDQVAAGWKSAQNFSNNFREKHGDQVAAGWKSTKSFSKDMATKANNARTGASSSSAARPSAYQPPSPVASPPSAYRSPAPPPAQSPELTAVAAKKKPPPPPPKKKELSGSFGNSPEPPPPLPLASKPRY